MVNQITTAEAQSLRRFLDFEAMSSTGAANATEEPDYGSVMYLLGTSFRFYLPIEYATGSGRAACRLCEGKIRKGERCIAFEFDPFGGKDSFGRKQRAYLHTNCEGGGDA